MSAKDAGSFLALLTAAACLAGLPAKPARRAAPGPWGATGINLEVTESGGTIEYDCANGSISEPLVLDAEGRFDVRGLHFRGHPGPVRENEDSKGEPVRYTGSVRGDEMTLTVRPENSDSPFGTFTLTRGKPGRIRRCL